MSQALTLFTTPVVYLYLDRMRLRFGSKRQALDRSNCLHGNARRRLAMLLQSSSAADFEARAPKAFIAAPYGHPGLHIHVVICRNFPLTVVLHHDLQQAGSQASLRIGGRAGKNF